MNGLILVNKHRGVSSFYITNTVKKLLMLKKCGHLGTLDPMADGLLPILVGEATKLSPFLMELSKSYFTTILLGVETATGDSEGEIISRSSLDSLDEKSIIATFNQLKGELYLSPPIWSAKKIGGKPAYRFARKGIEVELKPQLMIVKESRIEKIKLPYFTCSLIVSKGTYVRSLAIEFGKRLGVGATVFSLTRTSIGQYTLKNAVKLEELKKFDLTNQDKFPIIPISQLLSFMPMVKIEQGYEGLVKNGVILPMEKLISNPHIIPNTLANLVNFKGDTMAIINWKPAKEKLYEYKRVINI